MADVAQRAGVSHQTVSRVLNGFEAIRPETRDRVLEAYRGLPIVGLILFALIAIYG
jgi:DNA-binding LacI/PurR family transcriptional regulator